MHTRISTICAISFLIAAPAMAAEDAPLAPSVSNYGVEKLMSGQIISPSDQYKGVVKVEVDSINFNYRMPWQTGQYQSGIGTAFLIGKKTFLTNAHVVSNAQRIYISRHGSSRKIPAKVKFIAHDSDLALLEVEAFSEFADLPYFELSPDLPKLEDEVRAIGYPVGGDRLSVTRGVVSRIDFTVYAHPKNSQHLTIQIDAAINPGNSGGPVLIGNKVIGVAFQGKTNAQATGYVIPSPVIQRFLKDVRDGHYDSYVSVGAGLIDIVNPAMRKGLQLPDNEKGILVGEVVKGGSADGVLQRGDVILTVEDHEVDSSGMVELDGEAVRVNELTERSFKGDILHMTILRNGKPVNVEVSLKAPAGAEILAEEYDKLPRYVVYGGLVFQPLQRNALVEHEIPFTNVALELREFSNKGGALEKDDLVMITSVLDHEINSKVPDVSDNRIVEKINGVPVKGLTHLNELLYKNPGDAPFVTIEMKGSNRPIVFEKKDISIANEQIAQQYGIHANSRLDATPPKPENYHEN